MSVAELIAAVQARLSQVTTYGADIPELPVFPYVMVSVPWPLVSDRALTGAPQARLLRVRTTVVGLSEASARVTASKVDAAFEHASLTVAGWGLGRIENEPNGQPLRVDKDVTVGALHPLYQVLDWRLSASSTG